MIWKKIKRKLRYNRKRSIVFIFMAVVACGLGLGYAMLSTQLSIEGTSKFHEATWDVHFENIQVKEGSITPTSPATITNPTTVAFNVKLENPNDYYEFTVDVVNSGTLNAMIGGVNILPALTPAQQEYLDYRVTYRNNKDISVKQQLDAGTSEIIKVHFSYKENTDPSQYPTEDQNFPITIEIEYIQKEEDADPVSYFKKCTYQGTLTQGAEFIEGPYTYHYMQEYDKVEDVNQWVNISDDGWGVRITDATSTDPITEAPCTTINNKPIVSMSRMFHSSQATSIDLSKFNTRYVKNMKNMFGRITNITQLDVSGFDTGNVINMSAMFANDNLQSLDLQSFDTSNVTSMASMFYNSTIGNMNLNSFDTGNVTNMSAMFDTLNTNKIDIRNFDMSEVTTMTYMFAHSTTTEITFPEHLDGNKVTTMEAMFYESSTESLTFPKKMDTSNVTTMNNLFYDSDISTITFPEEWDATKVTSMEYAFERITTKVIDLSGFKTRDLQLMRNLFANSAVESITFSNNFVTNNVTDMSYDFYNTKLTGILDISNFDTSNATVTGIFANTTTLSTVYVRTAADRTKLNNSSGKPSGLSIVIKP